jgi:hypothetical protein
MTVMWPTLLSGDDQQRTAQHPTQPKEVKSHEIAPSMTTKEAANVISDSLMQHVDKALNSAAHSTHTALPPSQ